MTSSLIGADRSTHLKIAATAVVAATALVIVGLTARLSESPKDIAAVPSGASIVKAGSPVNMTTRTGVVVR
jgi:hypothetical protein